jgi:Icc protein
LFAEIRAAVAASAHILELSDIHFRAEPGEPLYEQDSDARLQAVLSAWAAFGRDLDLVLLTGDQTDDGSRSGCARLRDALEPLRAPVVAVLGNHDEQAAHDAIFDTGAVTTVGAWRVLGSNTSSPDRIHGQVDVGALIGAIDDLDPRPTLLHVHHPPVAPSTHPMFRLDGAAELLDALGTRPHVRAVLSGHVHTPFTVLPSRGPALLGCPATIAAFRHRGDRLTVETMTTTGARYLELGPDGGFRTELLLA